ncbi:MAG TPA: hypothetical protein VMI55_05570 [Thermoplasmata archaeon]|nr:hypothetical protein [Thermoplasmata archaeon]
MESVIHQTAAESAAPERGPDGSIGKVPVPSLRKIPGVDGRQHLHNGFNEPHQLIILHCYRKLRQLFSRGIGQKGPVELGPETLLQPRRRTLESAVLEMKGLLLGAQVPK